VAPFERGVETGEFFRQLRFDLLEKLLLIFAFEGQIAVANQHTFHQATPHSHLFYHIHCEIALDFI